MSSGHRHRFPFVLVLSVAAFVACASPARASVISFDSLACSELVGTVGDFTFNSGFGTVCAADYNAPGAGLNTVPFPSDPVAVGNLYDPDNLVIPTVTGTTPFVFNGAEVTFYTQDNAPDFLSALSLTIVGSLGGVQQFQIVTNFADYLDNNFASVAGSLAGIDTLEFFSSGLLGVDGAFQGDLWLMDNVDLELVPEPATLMLLGSGLSAVAALMRSRRRRAPTSL